MTKHIEHTKTKRKGSMNFIIAKCIREQVDELMVQTDKTTLNLFCYLSSIPEAYLHEDSEAIHITLKQPQFKGEPSVFDFRKSRLKELIVEIKARWPLNCTYADETSLTVVKIVGANCIEQYNRDTYLSNGSRQEPTKMYNDYNKGRSTGAKKNLITIEVED